MAPAPVQNQNQNRIKKEARYPNEDDWKEISKLLLKNRVTNKIYICPKGNVVTEYVYNECLAKDICLDCDDRFKRVERD
jgi:hypothetical protein